MKRGALQGQRVLLVVAPAGFCDEELADAKAALEAHGAAVEVASTTTAPARGEGGAEVTPDLAVSAADPHRYAAIAIVGGEGAAAHLWEHGALHALLRLAHADGKPIGALSHASPVLARAGLLRGVRATAFGTPRAKHELVRGGALYVEDDVVADQGIVTSARRHAAKALVERAVQAVLEARPGEIRP